MGNLLTCLRDYIKRDKVVIVHLRNVTSPLPNFTETFLDEGYGDIFEIIRSIVEKNYKGTIILDHTPELTGGLGLETAFCAGYIKAMIRASQVVAKNGKRTDDLTLCLGTKCERATLAIKAKTSKKKGAAKKVSSKSKNIKKNKK